MQSQEIRRLVQQEGKSARNLVAWTVPAIDVRDESQDGFKPVTRKTRRTRQRGKPKGRSSNKGIDCYERDRKRFDPNRPPVHNGLSSKEEREPLSDLNLIASSRHSSTVSEEVCVAMAEHYSDIHAKQRQKRESKSPGSRIDLNARYWSYLFDNLHRAVDEIYVTCEADESVIECQEVIMTLDLCQKDFVALIRRFQLFEQQQLQARPSNLAWEVRKTTSPSKARSQGLRRSLSPSQSPAHHHHPTKSHSQDLSRLLATARPAHPSLTGDRNSTSDKRSLRTDEQDKSSRVDRDSFLVEKGEHTHHTETTSLPDSAPPSSLPDSAPPTSLPGTAPPTSHPSTAPPTSLPSTAPPLRGSRPSSARSLNFSTCSNEGRVDKHVLFRSESQEVKPSIGRKSELVPDVPTWADRVKGFSQGNGISNATRQETTSSKSENSQEPPKTVADDNELEEGWEKVTRTRSRSASSSSKSSRSCQAGNHTHHTQRHTQKHVSHTHKHTECVRDGEHNGIRADLVVGTTLSPTESDPSSNEASNSPVFDSSESTHTGKLTRSEPVENLLASHASVENEFKHHSADSASEHNDVQLTTSEEVKVTLEEISDSKQYILEVTEDKEDEKNEIKEPSLTQSQSSEAWSWNDVIADYKAGENYRQEVSWADRCDSPPGMLGEIPRSPGRAIHLHQRLSSPSRRRPPVEDVEVSRRIQDEKQAKAQLHRSRIQEEKTQKYKLVSDKVREARQSRDARIRQHREALEDKLQRAEILRESHLQEIIRKAQEEEAKVSEISFINTLEAQNKKMEVLERYQVQEARLQELQGERQRKREEQQAKEEAAQERRRAIESERVAKLMEQELKRREQEAKIEHMKQERERAREDIAREKARERERKLEARNAAIQTSVEELERKIQQKHNESSRRYDQQLEQKKMVAVSISRHASSDDAPRVEVYKNKKWCTLCDVEIISEVYLLSHLRGRKHQEALASLPSGISESDLDAPVIIEASEEHQESSGGRLEVQERMKTGKKRAKKIRRRISGRVREEMWSTTVSAVQAKHRPKLQKALKELNRQLDATHASTTSTAHAWEASQVTLIDRSLGEMSRCLTSGSPEDRLCFCQLGGVASVLRLLVMGVMENSGRSQKIPSVKTLQYAINVLQSACTGHTDNCRYLILSNKTAPIIDILLQLLSEGHHRQGVGVAPEAKTTFLCGTLLGVLASVVSTLASGPLHKNPEELTQPLTDIISYMVSVGLVDDLCDYFSTITGPIEDAAVTQLVIAAINLIVATTACMHTRVVDVFSGKPCDDPTCLTVVLQQTELVGLMQLLYAILLHDGPPRHSSIPPPLTQSTLAIATATIRAINNCAILDLQMVQACLGAEGVSLEFRHVVSYLLWYCSHNNCTSLLHELILAVGYFCVLNRENQVFLQCGRSPTLLQLLCDLPFQYFSNPDLSKLLYPTLISACYRVEENVTILEQEISCKLLVAFLQESLAQEKKMAEAKKASDTQGYSLDFSALEHRFPRLHWQEAVQFFSR